MELWSTRGEKGFISRFGGYVIALLSKLLAMKSSWRIVDMVVDMDI